MSPEMNFEGNKILISPTNSKETTHIIWTNIEIARSCQTWQISFTCNELSRECQRGCPRLRLRFWVRISSIKGWIFLPSKMERCSKDSSCFGLPTQNNEYSRCSSFWNFSFIQLFDFSTLKIKPFHFSTFRSSTFRKYVFNVLFDWNHAPPLSNPGFWRLVLQAQQSHYQDDKDDSKSQLFFWEWKITEHLLNLRMGQIIQHPKTSKVTMVHNQKRSPTRSERGIPFTNQQDV